MYITELTLTFFPGKPEESRINVPLTILQDWNGTGAPEIKGFAALFASENDLQVRWNSWEHSEHSRTGSIDFMDTNDEDSETIACANWHYDPLDDPDNGEPLEVPLDNKYLSATLTPDQYKSFWACVNPELEPLDHLGQVLRRFGMTPADHDNLDHRVMEQVIAIQWWRAYPSTATGQFALNGTPDLTNTVIDQINTMAINCYFDGKNYDLYTTFVS
jgi:hypothetical protein